MRVLKSPYDTQRCTYVLYQTVSIIFVFIEREETGMGQEGSNRYWNALAIVKIIYFRVSVYVCGFIFKK